MSCEHGSSSDYRGWNSTETGKAEGGAIVRIQNLKFVPNLVYIRVGQQVTWRNVDTVTHTVASDTFDSKDIPRGSEFAATFSQPGTYPYSCQIHPSMTGWVVVVAR